MRYQVFIEGVEIDIDPKQIIAITLQAVEFGSGNPVSRLTSFTNQITVPATGTNVAALGYSKNIQSASTFPYNVKTFSILCSGIQIMTGVVTIKNVNEKVYNLNFFGVDKGLALALGTKVLSDLDFGDSAVTWNATTWDALRNARSGFPITDGAITAPVINYGQMDLSGNSIGDYYLPSVFYKYIIKHIFEEAGYTPTGDFYDNDDFFNRMVMTYGKKSWPGTSFKTNEILPDHIKQIDVVQDFLARFFLFPRFSGTEVEFVQTEDILAASPVDWTAKRTNKKYVLEHDWPGWTQANRFTYPSMNPDTAMNSYFKAVTNDGSIDVGNANLEVDREVFSSLFSPHQSMQGTQFEGDPGNIFGSTLTILGATCPVWNNVPTDFLPFDNEPKPMLCLLRDPDTFTPTGGPGAAVVEGAVKYDGNSRTDYKIAWFANTPVDSALAYEYSPVLDNLRFKNNFGTAKGLLDLYCPTLETILQTAKKTTNYYQLSELDIANLDLLTPIFDTDSRFLISKVYDFVPGRSTKVDLLKI